MSPPDLSVVIVNWNGGDLVVRVVEALLRSAARLSLEVILVDNASQDGSAEHILSRFPQVRYVQTGSDLGFCRANNRGLAMATGRAVLLLNPDAVVEGEAVRVLYDYVWAHPDVGVVGPRLMLPDGRLDAACRRHAKTMATYFHKMLKLDRLRPNSRRFGRYNLTYLEPSVTTEVDSISGACLLVRREALDAIGTFMDERFIMTCEDEDWCLRIRAEGWRIVYQPAAVVWHYKGSSSSRHLSRRERIRMTYHKHRSMWLFHRKHLSPRYHPILNGIVLVAMIVVGAGAILLTLFKTHRQLAWGDALPSESRGGMGPGPRTEPGPTIGSDAVHGGRG